MLKLILVRHGQTKSNKIGAFVGHTDVPLNRTGIEEAIEVADKLRDEAIDKIYCSPLKRARETASIIHEIFPKEIIFDEALKEINFGLWDNLTYKEIEERYPKEHSEWIKGKADFIFPKGESVIAAYTRHKSFLDKILKEEGNFLIVAHGGFIRNAISMLLGMKVEDSWHFKVDNGSISEVEITEGYVVVKGLNR